MSITSMAQSPQIALALVNPVVRELKFIFLLKTSLFQKAMSFLKKVLKIPQENQH